MDGIMKLKHLARIALMLQKKSYFKAKAKASDSYMVRLTGTKPDQLRFTIIGSGS